eukprot:451746-Amorphochlora_amoeboformis.AAC.1
MVHLAYRWIIARVHVVTRGLLIAMYILSVVLEFGGVRAEVPAHRRVSRNHEPGYHSLTRGASGHCRRGRVCIWRRVGSGSSSDVLGWMVGRVGGDVRLSFGWDEAHFFGGLVV